MEGLQTLQRLQAPLMLKGWDITTDEARNFRNEGKIFMAYMDMTAACDLHCVYCQARSGKALPNELNLEERKEIIDQFTDMGCRAIHFAGQGEPTLDPYLWEILEYCNKKEIIPVVFTHGANLDRKKIKRLKELHTSLIIKVHSFIPEVQDQLVGVKGYTKKREKVLEMLLEEGYSKESMLGIDTVITYDNQKELETIFRYCRENHIFPEFKTMITAYRAKKVVDKYQLTAQEVESIAKRFLEIDEQDYGYTWEITPPYIAWTCNFYYGHIYVNIMGDIYPCVGFTMDEPLGNVREMKIKQAYDLPLMKKIRNIDQEITGVCKECPKDCYGCPCRRLLKTGDMESIFHTKGCWSDIV